MKVNSALQLDGAGWPNACGQFDNTAPLSTHLPDRGVNPGTVVLPGLQHHGSLAPGQEIGVPMMASVLAGFERGSAVLDFDGHSKYAAEESFSIRGTRGTIRAHGGVCAAHHIEVEAAGGAASLEVEGAWFPDGFAGTMGELLCAIEEEREPENGAEDNLKTLDLVFAAIAAAAERKAVKSGTATRI